MARADTRTLLPLDRFTQIVSYSPILFNQVYIDTDDLQRASSCSDPILQYTWQPASGGQPGREEIAQAIQQAEDQIESILKFSLLPRWYAGARVAYPENGASPSSWLYRTPRNQTIAVRAPTFHVLQGGVEAWSLIGAGAAIAYSDVDGDGYDELATVTVATTITDADEIAVYYPGVSAADRGSWEIRPIKVSFSGGVATVKFARQQCVLAALLERLNAAGVDGMDNANFLTTVDVYRHYNDPSTMATLEWEGCTCNDSCAVCSISTQSACITVRDEHNGLIALSPGDWNADDAQYDCACLSVGRRPDRVRLYYRGGYRDTRVARPMNEMAPQLEKAITYMALVYLDREWLTCEQIHNLMEHWRADMATSVGSPSGLSTSTKLSAESLRNPLGTTRAAFYAYDVIKRMLVGEAVLGS